MRSLTPERLALRETLFTAHAAAAKTRTIAEHTVSATQAELRRIAERQEDLYKRVENLKLASSVLQECVDAVAAKNITRTEELVDSALAAIFPDQNLKFRLISEVKRNTIQYRIAIIQDGHEGTINSYGGGPVAVIAVVLKILFNRLSGRAPLIVLDESLSFLSEKYIANASTFLKEISTEFHIPILMVTHQPRFAQLADQVLQAEPAGTRDNRPAVQFRPILASVSDE